MTTATQPRASRAKKPADTAPVPDTNTGDLLADVAPQPGSALATLPPSERAAVVLQSAKAEQELRALVERTTAITSVVDAAGREETHRAAMTIKNARVAIEKTGKAAREDATAFSKAVIAEEKRLNAIIEAEEERLFKLRDDFDAEQARIKAEQERKAAERVAAIRAIIDNITALPRDLAAADSVTLKATLQQLAMRKATKEEFAELTDEAALAIEATGSALHALYTGALAREQAEAERIRVAEEQRIEGERLRAEREKVERAQQEAAQAAASLKLAQEQQQRTMEEVSALQRSAEIADTDARGISTMLDTVRAWPIDAEYLGAAGAGMVTMARDMAIKTLEQRYAQAVAEELPEAHAEALEMNAERPAPGIFDGLFADYIVDTILPAPAPAPEPAPEPAPPPFRGAQSFGAMPEFEQAQAAETAPEPAPLPLPEAYSPVDEQIDIGLFETPTDDEILDLIESEYGWHRSLTIRRLQVLLANHETQAAA